MLGGLLALLGLGISGAGAVKDNIEMKNYSRHIDEDGNLVYMDRHCREYYNGERTRDTVIYDELDNPHRCVVGVNSGKVYKDYYGNSEKNWSVYSEGAYKTSMKYGKLAYGKYDPRFGRPVTVEISTGKVITCLYEETCSKTYYKFYLSDWALKNRKQSAYQYTAPSDLGVEITKEEYDKLNIIGGGHITYLYHQDVEDKLRRNGIKREYTDKGKPIPELYKEMGWC